MEPSPARARPQCPRRQTAGRPWSMLVPMLASICTTTPDVREDRVDRREAIVKRGEQRRGFVPYWLRTMAEVDIDFLEAYERIYELTAVRKGKLPPKFREMIVVAAVAIGGYLPGLKDHVCSVGLASRSGPMLSCAASTSTCRK